MEQPKATIKRVSEAYFAQGRFAGKVILVTGAARGIGAAVATRLAREGAKVVAFDILGAELADTVAKITAEGNVALAHHGDVRVAADIAAAIELAVREYGALDGACNAAGVMDGTPPDADLDLDRDSSLYPSGAATATDEYWNVVMAVNATGVFNSCRAELQQLLKQGKGGAIVNIASIAGLIGLPGNVAYSASKYAVQGITKSVALSYSKDAIRCNSVNMAATDTPMVARAMEFVKETMKRSGASGFSGAPGTKNLSLLAAADPDHRPASVWEQAAVILFLLSDEASNITGADWATDGGWTAY